MLQQDKYTDYSQELLNDRSFVGKINSARNNTGLRFFGLEDFFPSYRIVVKLLYVLSGVLIMLPLVFSSAEIMGVLCFTGFLVCCSVAFKINEKRQTLLGVHFYDSNMYRSMLIERILEDKKWALQEMRTAIEKTSSRIEYELRIAKSDDGSYSNKDIQQAEESLRYFFPILKSRVEQYLEAEQQFDDIIKRLPEDYGFWCDILSKQSET